MSIDLETLKLKKPFIVFLYSTLDPSKEARKHPDAHGPKPADSTAALNRPSRRAQQNCTVRQQRKGGRLQPSFFRFGVCFCIPTELFAGQPFTTLL